MSFIQVSKGGPPPEADIPDGVYLVTLTEIKDPRTVTARRGPKAGQDIDLIDWIFAIVDGDYADREVDTSTSKASGPKSKMFSFLTALLGGKPPAVGQEFSKTDLVGRMALATVNHDEDGWVRIENLGAVPASMLSRRVAEATGAPVAEVPTAAASPVREAVGAGVGSGDELPF